MLEHLSTFADPLILAGDVNIRLDYASTWQPSSTSFWRLTASSSKSPASRMTPAELLTLYAREATCHRQAWTSLTSESPIIVCCAGRRSFIARRPSTPPPSVDFGVLATRKFSGPTCWRPRRATIVTTNSMVTLGPNYITQPSWIYSIGISLLGALRVVNGDRVCGTTTNVVERRPRFLKCSPTFS